MAKDKDGLLFNIEADDKTAAIFAGAIGNAKAFARNLSSAIAAPFRALTSMNTFALTQNLKTIGTVATGFTELFAEQQRAELKLGQILKSTGFAAGFTTNQLKEQASAMQDQTTFGDEVILNAQALLATFKNIKGDNFKAATEAMLDMSAVIGSDLSGSAIQLGKALNDPIKGVSALSRVGVTFNSSQMEMIKKFTAMGDAASAQRVILAELKGEFGDVARAMTGGGSGALSQMRNAVSDIGESLGEVLDPFVRSTALKFRDLAKSINSTLAANMRPLQDMFSGSLKAAFGALGTSVQAFTKPLVDMFGGGSAVATNLAAFAAKIPVWFSKAFLTVEQGALRVFAKIAFAVGQLIEPMAQGIAGIIKVTQGSGAAKEFMNTMIGASTAVTKLSTGFLRSANAMDSAFAPLDDQLKKIDETAATMAEKAHLKKVADDAKEAALQMRVRFTGAATEMGEKLRNGFSRIFDPFKSAAKGAADAGKQAADAVADRFKAAADRMKDAAEALRGAESTMRTLGRDESRTRFDLRLARVAGNPTQERRVKLERAFELERMAKDAPNSEERIDQLKQMVSLLADLAKEPEIMRRHGDVRMLFGNMFPQERRGHRAPSSVRNERILGDPDFRARKELLRTRDPAALVQGLMDAGLAKIKQTGYDDEQKKKEAADLATANQGAVAREVLKQDLAPVGQAAKEFNRFVGTMGKAAEEFVRKVGGANPQSGNMQSQWSPAARAAGQLLMLSLGR